MTCQKQSESPSGNAAHAVGKLMRQRRPLGINDPANINNKEWYSRGYMPHRNKLNLLQSITFRLGDSLPQKILIQLQKEVNQLPKEKQDLQKRIKTENYLDAGIGCCALKHPRMAEIVENAFLKFDGNKYNLIAWCIMPNHVHILIEPLIQLGKIVQSWKSFTGRWAMRHNAELTASPLLLPHCVGGVPREKENFWMREYWDRYIRNEEHLQKTINYIHNNPVKAGLCNIPKQWKWSSAG